MDFLLLFFGLCVFIGSILLYVNIVMWVADLIEEHISILPTFFSGTWYVVTLCALCVGIYALLSESGAFEK